MNVHAPSSSALDSGMANSTTEPLPFPAGDPEWVADLLDTLRAGDLDALATQLDDLAGVVRKAAKAQQMLSTLEPALLRAGLQARSRRESGA